MASPNTILLVDDDDDLRAALKDQFALYEDEFRIIEEACSGRGMNGSI